MNIRYSSEGSLTHFEINEALTEVYARLAADPAETARLRELGLDVDDLRASITVTPDSHESDWGTVAIWVGMVGPAVNHALITAWDTIVLPRLRRQFGDDALGDEEERDPG